MMKFTFILIIILFFSGCIITSEKIVIDDEQFQSAPRDTFLINNVQIYKNFLKFNISYSGGCMEHIFKLISTSFMESYPVQVNILLSHEDNNDSCEAWITEILIYDISPLKVSWQKLYNEKNGIIIMNIENWEESINYRF